MRERQAADRAQLARRVDRATVRRLGLDERDAAHEHGFVPAIEIVQRSRDRDLAAATWIALRGLVAQSLERGREFVGEPEWLGVLHRRCDEHAYGAPERTEHVRALGLAAQGRQALFDRARHAASSHPLVRPPRRGMRAIATGAAMDPG